MFSILYGSHLLSTYNRKKVTDLIIHHQKDMFYGQLKYSKSFLLLNVGHKDFASLLNYQMTRGSLLTITKNKLNSTYQPYLLSQIRCTVSSSSIYLWTPLLRIGFFLIPQEPISRFLVLLLPKYVIHSFAPHLIFRCFLSLIRTWSMSANWTTIVAIMRLPIASIHFISVVVPTLKIVFS